MEHVEPDEVEDVQRGCKLLTAMDGKAYRSFVVDGQYLTFWQTGPTWHYKYSDNPTAGRQFNDLRLYGQIGENTAYAVLSAPVGHFSLPYGSPEELLRYVQ